MNWFLTAGVASIVVILVLGGPPAWLEIQRQRTHIRLVSARLDHRYEALDENPGHRFLTGADLTIVNAGNHQVRNITVLDPSQLLPHGVKRLGPGERYTTHLPAALVSQLETEPSITLRLEDAHGRMWRYSPTDLDLTPMPQPMTPLAYLVQASSLRWPQSWRPAFDRLPHRAQRILWGYIPSRG
ncbi:hypothetical protein [Arthrobacter sp. RIT-PI-e]|uniref:hypothetical protein n=1 Tax=Arthrobacter sp. RIT-PI-e TaxID=1681197 RepID=UPI000B032B89|nr:hypothetical protein [Arthrobacter sp. RIT-PI-e]